MDVSGSSLTDSIVAMASGSQSLDVQTKIAAAVMKQIQDQQKQEAKAILKMIEQSRVAAGVGTNVNIAV